MPVIDLASLSVGQFEIARLAWAQLQYEKVVRLQVLQSVGFEALSNYQQWPRLFPWVHTTSLANRYPDDCTQRVGSAAHLPLWQQSGLGRNHYGL